MGREGRVGEGGRGVGVDVDALKFPIPAAASAVDIRSRQGECQLALLSSVIGWRTRTRVSMVPFALALGGVGGHSGS